MAASKKNFLIIISPILNFRINYMVHQISRPKCSLFADYVSCSIHCSQEQQILQETTDRLNLWFQKNEFKFSIAKRTVFHFYKVRNYDHSILIDLNNTHIYNCQKTNISWSHSWWKINLVPSYQQSKEITLTLRRLSLSTYRILLYILKTNILSIILH